MGACCCSCGRRRRSTATATTRSPDAEREPLLPKNNNHADPKDVLSPPRSQFDQAADVLGALKAGKLPSQAQFDAALRKLLHSSVFDMETDGEYGSLSEHGRKVLGDVTDIIEAVMEAGMEKNDDDILQDTILQLSNTSGSPVHADIAVNVTDATAGSIDTVLHELPSSEEGRTDSQTLVRSLGVLCRVLLTSSTFRILLSDVIVAARHMVADAAAEVGGLASQVEYVADTLEEAVRPLDQPARDSRVKEQDGVADDIKARWADISSESPERVKETVIARLQEAMIQAHKSPAYRNAFHAIIWLTRKYSSKFDKAAAAVCDADAPTVTPVVWMDPPLIRALAQLQTLLERIASGRSLAPLLHRASTVIADIAAVPAGVAADSPHKLELKTYFSALGTWLDRALAEPRFATSTRAQADADMLYDRGRALVAAAANVDADTHWVRDARALFGEVDTYISALTTDRATSRLVRALDTLSNDVASLTAAAATGVPRKIQRERRRLQNQLRRDAVTWLLPRILRAVKAVPMPRLEYTTPRVDVAIDALLLTSSSSASASFVPDHVHLTTWSELQLDVIEHDVHSALPGHTPGDVRSHTRMRVHVDGLRVAAHDVSYYVRYKGTVGYEDQGLVSVCVGSDGAAGEGLSVDVELEFRTDSDADANSDAEAGEPLFVVRDVRVDAPGLRFEIERSRHWIVNRLVVQPLAGPLVRATVGRAVAKQIWAALETVAGLAGDVQGEVAGRAEDDGDGDGPSFREYCSILLEKASVPTADNESESDDESERERVRDTGGDSDDSPLVTTHTSATLKGIVHTTVTQNEPNASAPPTPDETVLAVGIGAQILPGKGGPYGGQGPEAVVGPTAVAREAVDEVQHVADDVGRRAERALDDGERLREMLDRAGTRGTVRERVERRRRGWRSRAFDL